MKYYDYYDLDDEIGRAKSVYNENEKILEQYNNEIHKLEKEKQEIGRKKNEEKDKILKRKYERQEQETLNLIEEKNKKVKEISSFVEKKINLAKARFENKIDEKNKKIQKNEEMIANIETQIDHIKKKIDETRNTPDADFEYVIKQTIIETLSKEKERYEKMINEFIENSERWTEERIEISNLYEDFKLAKPNDFWEEKWKKVKVEGIEQPTSSKSQQKTIETQNTKKEEQKSTETSKTENKQVVGEKVTETKKDKQKTEETKKSEPKIIEAKSEEQKSAETERDKQKTEEIKKSEPKITEAKSEEQKSVETEKDKQKAEETKKSEPKITETKRKEEKPLETQMEEQQASEKKERTIKAESRLIENLRDIQSKLPGWKETGGVENGIMENIIKKTEELINERGEGNERKSDSTNGKEIHQEDDERNKGVEDEEKSTEVKILVRGKNGIEIEFSNGNKYSIPSRKLKGNIKLGNIDQEASDKEDSIIEIKGNRYFDNNKENIDKSMENLDLYILRALAITGSKDLSDSERAKLGKAVEAYIKNAKEQRNVDKYVEVKYDRSGLAKMNIPFFSKILRGRFSRKEKNYINQMSEKTENWTENSGTYTINPIRRHSEEKRMKKEIGEGNTKKLKLLNEGGSIFKENLYYNTSSQRIDDKDRGKNRATHEFLKGFGGSGR